MVQACEKGIGKRKAGRQAGMLQVERQHGRLWWQVREGDRKEKKRLQGQAGIGKGKKSTGRQAGSRHRKRKRITGRSRQEGQGSGQHRGA